MVASETASKCGVLWVKATLKQPEDPPKDTKALLHVRLGGDDNSFTYRGPVVLCFSKAQGYDQSLPLHMTAGPALHHSMAQRYNQEYYLQNFWLWLCISPLENCIIMA